MRIRKINKEDFKAVADLIRSAILRLNKIDYSEEQIQLWSDNFKSPNKLIEKSKEHNFFVCVNEEDFIMGVYTLNTEGFIHYFFVHPEYTRLGVATFMFDFLEKNSKVSSLEVHASQTIFPFFIKRSFNLIKEQFPTIQGVRFKNYHLKKNINA